MRDRSTLWEPSRVGRVSKGCVFGTVDDHVSEVPQVQEALQVRASRRHAHHLVRGKLSGFPGGALGKEPRLSIERRLLHRHWPAMQSAVSLHRCQHADPHVLQELPNFVNRPRSAQFSD